MSSNASDIYTVTEENGLWQIRLWQYRDDYLIFREGSGHSIELYDIAVNSARRVGRGTLLLWCMFSEFDCHSRFDRTPEQPLRNVFAFVRGSNRKAHQFYLKNGFQHLSSIPQFYSDELGQDDALIFRTLR